jgi:hypothetical protein
VVNTGDVTLYDLTAGHPLNVVTAAGRAPGG